MTINIQSRKIILIVPIVNTCVLSGVIVMHYASCVNVYITILKGAEINTLEMVLNV